MAKKIEAEAKEAFTKDQFYNSKKYEEYKDLIQILLEEDKNYTFEEVDSMIKEFLKKEVK